MKGAVFLKTVAIISEYNPFHLGHAHHLSMIRERFGSQTAIIAIMSGSYVQRGDMAVMDSYLRARVAVDCGVNLVLKLPFPFSCSSAEFFATAGVRLAHALGIVDVLSFGSECDSVDTLTRVADRLESDVYQNALIKDVRSRRAREMGHAARVETLYRMLFGDDGAETLHAPNALLAIEYIKALQRLKTTIVPHTVKRAGSGYHETDVTASCLPSATAIRQYWKNEYGSPCFREDAFVPKNASLIYSKARATGEMPVDINRLSNVFLAFLRNTFPFDAAKEIADDDGGILHHIKKNAMDAIDIDELIRVSGTKKYTDARMRRLLLYAFFGVTSSDIRADPLYTQVLGFDERGRSLLRAIRKKGTVELLTKPADYTKLSCGACRQAELDLRADSLFVMAKPVAERGGAPYRRTPYQKNSF